MGSTQGQENPLEKEMTTCSSILAWKIPQRNLVGYNPWSCKRLDKTEQLSIHMDSKMERSARNVYRFQFSSVQPLSRVQLFATPWIAARQASLSITISWTSLKLRSIELVMPSSHLILGRPLLLLPPIPPSIRVFSNKSTLLMRWPRYQSFSFSISPSNEHLGLISFRMDWLDLLAVQGSHRVFSSTTVQKHQFFGAQISSQSNSHIHTWLLEKP